MRSFKPICRSVMPSASGPSGVSCIGTIAAANTVAVDVDRPPHRVLADLRLQLGGEVRGERVGGLQHRVHQRAELRAHRQIRHRRRHIRARPPTPSTGSRRPRRLARRPRARCSPASSRRHGSDPSTTFAATPVSIDRWKCRAARSARATRAAARESVAPPTPRRRARPPPPTPQPRHRVVVRNLLGRNTIRHRGLTWPPAPQQPRQPAVGLVP